MKAILFILIAIAPLSALAEEIDYGPDPNMPEILPYQSESGIRCGSGRDGAFGSLEKCNAKGFAETSEVMEAIEVAQSIEKVDESELLKAANNLVRLPAGLAGKCTPGKKK